MTGTPVEHAPFDAHDAVAAWIGHRTQRGGIRNVAWTGPGAAAIFGSVAAGTDRRTGRLSDIDLLLVFSDASTRDERFAVRTAISEIAERLNREISVQAHLRSEWEEGRSSNRVLRRIAEGALLMLKGTI